MQKSVFVILLIIVFSWSPAFSGDVTYIDNRVRSESQEYAIVFSAYDGELGHAFVTIVWGDKIQNATLQKGVGFYPGNSEKDWKVAFGAQGSLEIDKWRDSEIALSVLVNKESYDAALAVVRKWEKPTPYFLGLRDCTTFVSEVAEAIGLDTPSRMFAPYPFEFVKGLVEGN